jgi:hypothetical protein
MSFKDYTGMRTEEIEDIIEGLEEQNELWKQTSVWQDVSGDPIEDPESVATLNQMTMSHLEEALELLKEARKSVKTLDGFEVDANRLRKIDEYLKKIGETYIAL